MDKYKLFDLPIIGKRIIKNKIVNHEKGEMYSLSLREYSKNNFKVFVDLYSYGGCFESQFNYAVAGEIHVGRYCSFGQMVRYFGANHPYENMSTSPFFYRKMFGFDVKDVKRYKLEIENDVWIGYGALITSGCKKIGNGAVIAAGAIVTKDVPAYAIVAGNPAKIIKMRFDTETIRLLEKSNWYSLTPDQIIEFKDYFSDPKMFAYKVIDKYGVVNNG